MGVTQCRWQHLREHLRRHRCHRLGQLHPRCKTHLHELTRMTDKGISLGLPRAAGTPGLISTSNHLPSTAQKRRIIRLRLSAPRRQRFHDIRQVQPMFRRIHTPRRLRHLHAHNLWKRVPLLPRPRRPRPVRIRNRPQVEMADSFSGKIVNPSSCRAPRFPR